MTTPILAYEILQSPANVRRLVDRWNKRAAKAVDRRRVATKAIKQPSGRIITEISLKNLRGRWSSMQLMASDDETATSAIRKLLADAKESVKFEF